MGGLIADGWENTIMSFQVQLLAMLSLSRKFPLGKPGDPWSTQRLKTPRFLSLYPESLPYIGPESLPYFIGIWAMETLEYLQKWITMKSSEPKTPISSYLTIFI